MATESELELLASGTITDKRATEKYGVPRSTLWAAMSSGKLAYTHFGKRRLIVERSLLELLAKRMVGAAK